MSDEVWITGATRAAEAIAREFSVSCNRQMLRLWRTLNPPFPLPRVSQGKDQWNQSEIFAWFEENKDSALSSKDVNSLREKAMAEARMKIRQDKLEELRFKKEKGTLIDRKQAEFSITTAMRQQHAFTRTEFESNLPELRRAKLQQLGIAEQLISVFVVFDIELGRSAIDRIEKRHQEAAQ